jgi:uncharacterized membrane protein YidH (DUF202 family)
MKSNMLAAFLIILGFLVSFHQYLNYGTWFEIKDIHHELFTVALIFAGVIILVFNQRHKDEHI